MRALDRKLLRDLRHLRGQIVSIACVVGCGIAAVVAMGSTLRTIERTRDAYYDRAAFADVFATLRRAPESLAARIRRIPGVALAETRVQVNALVRVPGLPEPALGFLASVPDTGSPALNRVWVRRGRFLAPGAGDEVLVEEHFARANALRPGDTLSAVINGRWRPLHIVGVAISPEFVHDLAPGFAQFADSRHAGVLWMSRESLGPLYDMEGSFNAISLTLVPGASERAVLARVDALLKPYGGGNAYGRRDQPSNQVVEGEMKQLRAFGIVMPAVFLLVAAFLVNVVLSRLVATQRQEVAVLKAFGYSNRVLAFHFLGYALAAVVLGAAIGTALGAWVGGRYTGLYATFFRFPDFTHHTSASLVLLAVAVSGGAAVLGALGAVRAAAALAPAEGMRPASPDIYRPLVLERLGLAGILSPAMRMVLRSLERRPWRALASTLGVALSAGVLVAGLFAFDVVRYLVWLQFEVVERHDVAVSFAELRPARVRHELGAIAGVRRVELYRALPVLVRHGHRSRRIALLGLERAAVLRRVVDIDGRAHPVPASGLVLTASLARTLELRRGDTVSLELLDRGGEVRRVPIVALVDELLGISGYMDLDQLNRLAREGPVASGAWLAIAPRDEAAVMATLGTLPQVSSATTRRATVESFERMIGENITMTSAIITLLAAVIAVGVLYNSARIALSERGRDLASLRVLGFTRREVATLLLGEQAAMNVAGIPLGLLVGIGLAHLIALGFESELYRFPVIVTARTYWWAIAVVLGASVASGLAIRRRLDGLDLIEVLKTRE